MADLLDLPARANYIARCACREWVLVRVLKADPCGACGSRPEYVGEYDGRADWGRAR